MAKDDIEQLKADVARLQAELDKTTKDAANAIQREARKAKRQLQGGSFSARSSLETIEDRILDPILGPIRDRPFTALGLALSAGFIYGLISR